MLWSINFANFHSRLKYGTVLWGRDGEIVEVFQLEEKVIWWITGVHKRESCWHIFRKFRILTLTSLYILEMLCFMKEYEGNQKHGFGIHGHNTRNKFGLCTQYSSTVLYQRSATNMGIQLFNKLPVQIKQVDSYKGFKREGKTFLLNNSFYMIWRIFWTLREYSNFTLGVSV